MDADSEAVDGCLHVADWHADINLAVVGVLVDVQTVTQEDTLLTKNTDILLSWEHLLQT